MAPRTQNLAILFADVSGSTRLFELLGDVIARHKIAQVLDHARNPKEVHAGHSAGIVLDREVDVSRGDWLLSPGHFEPSRELKATVAWLDDEPLVAGRTYWALHGHRWVKAKVTRIAHRRRCPDIGTDIQTEAHTFMFEYTGRRTRVEITLLVEDRIIGQRMFMVSRDDLTIAQDGSRVIAPVCKFTRMTDDHRNS